MILNLAQIASHATRLAANAALPMSVISDYVNIAIGHVSQNANIQHQPKETIGFASTSTSDNRMGFPGDYDYALGLKIGVPNSWSTATSRTTSWTPLQKVNTIEGAPYQSETSAQPIEYAEFSTWFELRPSPNSAYSVELRYARKLSELTASTATPALDEQWHWAIALKTAELIAMNGSDTTQEMLNAKRYSRYMADMRLDQARKRMDQRGQHVTFLRTQR